MIQVVLATAIGRVAQTGTALDVVDPADPITILAPLVAVLAAVAVAYMPRSLGQDTRLWRTIRGLLPYVDADGPPEPCVLSDAPRHVRHGHGRQHGHQWREDRDRIVRVDGVERRAGLCNSAYSCR